jgi:hypothetical protein
MLKIICLSIFFCCFSLCLNAIQPPLKQDSLLKILKINDPRSRERELLLFLRYYFGDISKDRLNAAQVETSQLLETYNVADRAAIGYFIESLCLLQVQKYRQAETALIRSIALAEKNDDSYLLYAAFTHLGFIQTYYGYMIEAVASFRMAKKQAALVNDPYLQVIVDINISDIYYKMDLYSQSVFYLNQAQSLLVKYRIAEPKIKNALNNNKAETYFHMGNIDSLKKYNQVLNLTTTGTFRLYSYQKRTDYYVDLLEHRYSKAISRMLQLRKDSLYQFDATDEQNLANAYFKAGQPDSARIMINGLLAGDAQKNHPEIRSDLYETLGLMAESDQDESRAALNFKLALQQAKEQISRLTRVDTIAAQIKIDEMQGAYVQKAERYKRERLWMGFTIIVTLMGLVIAALSYRNIKRKKYYEQLLFAAKKEELAFINSHEVRRHLANILGIMETIKQNENKHQAYMEAEEHLLSAAGELDKAIKNISAKLDT